MSAAVALVNPKFAHNVGGVLRACSIFGASSLVIPSLSCTNLSAAVNIVLYDRLAKNIRAHDGALA